MRTLATAVAREAAGSCAVLHGHHPLRGYPATWRITPLRREGRAPASFLVDHAHVGTDRRTVDERRDDQRRSLSERQFEPRDGVAFDADMETLIRICICSRYALTVHRPVLAFGQRMRRNLPQATCAKSAP